MCGAGTECDQKKQVSEDTVWPLIPGRVSRPRSVSQHRVNCHRGGLSEANFLLKERDGSERGQPGPLAGISLALYLLLHIDSLLLHLCLRDSPTLALAGSVTDKLLLHGEL